MDIKDLFCNDTKFYVKKKRLRGSYCNNIKLHLLLLCIIINPLKSIYIRLNPRPNYHSCLHYKN